MIVDKKKKEHTNMICKVRLIWKGQKKLILKKREKK
jgi:hypothetical protein